MRNLENEVIGYFTDVYDVDIHRYKLFFSLNNYGVLFRHKGLDGNDSIIYQVVTGFDIGSVAVVDLIKDVGFFGFINGIAVENGDVICFRLNGVIKSYKILNLKEFSKLKMKKKYK